MLYKIKYRRLVEGKWDGIFHTSKIEAPNEYQAVCHLGTYSEENEEYEIVMVASTNGNPNTFAKGNEPSNIQLGVFWLKMDVNDNYDFIMERPYDSHE